LRKRIQELNNRHETKERDNEKNKGENWRKSKREVNENLAVINTASRRSQQISEQILLGVR
jgi:hypothetical protein